MSETGRSYVDSLGNAQEAAVTRRSAVDRAVRVARRIIGERGGFEVAIEGSPLYVPLADWDEEATAVLEVNSPDGSSITRANANNSVAYASTLALSAEFVVDNDHASGPVTCFTIQTEPPNVFGHDGAPLGTEGVNGVIGDLQRYERSLETAGA